MGEAMRQAGEIFRAAGWVGWPLAVLSVLALGLCLERALYFTGVRRSLTSERVSATIQALRSSDESALARQQKASILGRFVSIVLEVSPKGRITESAVLAGAEGVRPGLERYLSFLSTTITAAPMLGILGTVTGIIKSFGLLGSAEQVTDPAAMAVGISEALYTTAFGLVIALVILFPYNHFRASADRALGILETIGAAAMESAEETKSPRSKSA